MRHKSQIIILSNQKNQGVVIKITTLKLIKWKQHQWLKECS